MRKIIAITQVSLDGIMQAPGGPEEDPSGGFARGGWAMPYMDDDSGQEIGGIIGREFDLLLGRRTYDIWNSYWPQHGDNPIGEAFNKVTKYVVTHRAGGLDWKHSERVAGVEEVRRLKATPGPELHLWGSSAMMQGLIAADLIDEYRMWVIPVVLGSGKRLFENGVPSRGLALVETRRTPGGVLLNTYKPAGAVRLAEG